MPKTRDKKGKKTKRTFSPSEPLQILEDPGQGIEIGLAGSVRTGKKTGNSGLADLPAGFASSPVKKVLHKLKRHPLLWLQPAEFGFEDRSSSVTKELLKRTPGSSSRSLFSKLGELAASGHFAGITQQSTVEAWQLLQTAWLLGSAGTKSEDVKSGSWQIGLYTTIVEALNHFDEYPHERPDVWAWTQVETPLLLATMHGDSAVGSDLKCLAAKRLEEWFEISVDAEGALPGRWIEYYAATALSVFRSVRLGKFAGVNFSPRFLEQVDWMLRQFLLLATGKQGILFSGRRIKLDSSMGKWLNALTDDASDRRLLRQVSGECDFKLKQLPEPCHFSQGQMVGVLRTGWGNQDCCVGISCDGQIVSIDVRRNETLLKGQLTGEWSLNGGVVNWDDASWSVNCWHEDSDVQYLELQLECESGMKFQRQFALLVKDEIMLIGDSILGVENSRIDYRMSLPVAETITAVQESDTREVYLQGGESGIRALVIPFSIGEWKFDHTNNAFRIQPDEAILQQSAVQDAMFAGIAIDLNPARAVRPRTWRQLTVGEALEVVPPDEAVAFRIQSGKSQWILYRNLSRIGNRTFLGVNVCNDFYIGRFDPEGKQETLLMIET